MAYCLICATADVAKSHHGLFLHAAILGVDVHRSLDRLHCSRVSSLLSRHGTAAAVHDDAIAHLSNRVCVALKLLECPDSCHEHHRVHLLCGRRRR